MLKLLNKFRKVGEAPLNSSTQSDLVKGQLDLTAIDVILHIGSPKTGSSALQKYCCNNAKLLRSHGIYYPDHNLDSNGISGGHWDLAQHIVNGDLEQAKIVFTDYIKQAKAKKCTLMVSAESFFIRPNAVMEVVGSYRVHIVGFFRHPLEALQSHYNQGVKRHFSTAKIQHVARTEQIIRPGITGESVLDWVDLVEKYSITILPYTNSKVTQFDTPNQMMSLLGVPYRQPETRLINNSYTQSALEFKRLINSILDPENGVMNAKLDQKLQRYSDHIEGGRPGLKDLLGEQLFKDVESKYLPIVKAVEECFSIEIPYTDSLTQGHSFDSPEMVWEYISNDEETLRYLNKCLHQRLVSGERSYDLVKLAEWMGIEFDSLAIIGGEADLTSEEVFSVINPKAQMPDTLRELAKLLERLGRNDHALKVATRALELRPKGPYLNMLVKRLSTYVVSDNKES